MADVLGESKGQFKSRVTHEGNVARFEKVRLGLIQRGVPGDEAYEEAAARFPPRDDKDPVGRARALRRNEDRKAGKQTGSSPHVPGQHPKSAFRAKNADPVSVVRWVASNLAVSDVRPCDAISSEAWRMREWVLSSRANEGEFWRQIYSKIMPSRSEIDDSAARHDDGGDLLELHDRLLKLQSEAEAA